MLAAPAMPTTSVPPCPILAICNVTEAGRSLTLHSRHPQMCRLTCRRRAACGYVWLGRLHQECEQVGDLVEREAVHQTFGHSGLLARFHVLDVGGRDFCFLA